MDELIYIHQARADQERDADENPDDESAQPRIDLSKVEYRPLDELDIAEDPDDVMEGGLIALVCIRSSFSSVLVSHALHKDDPEILDKLMLGVPSEQSGREGSKKKPTKKKSQKAAEKEVEPAGEPAKKSSQKAAEKEPQPTEGTSGAVGDGEVNPAETTAEKPAGQKCKRSDQGGVAEELPIPPPSLRSSSRGPVRFPAH